MCHLNLTKNCLIFMTGSFSNSMVTIFCRETKAMREASLEILQTHKLCSYFMYILCYQEIQLVKCLLRTRGVVALAKPLPTFIGTLLVYVSRCERYAYVLHKYSMLNY